MMYGQKQIENLVQQTSFAAKKVVILKKVINQHELLTCLDLRYASTKLLRTNESELEISQLAHYLDK